MAKVVKTLAHRKPLDVKKKFLFFYTQKFFNKWMSKYNFKGLNYQQQHFIMKKLWAEGTIACSSIKSGDNALAGLIADGSLDMGENELIFTPWTHAGRYNIYDFSTKVRLINTRGVKFITPNALDVDKEVVIIYAQKNHKSVFSSIEAKLNELVDIEMKKRSCRIAQSQSWLFTFSEEDREQAKVLQESMEMDAPYLFAPFDAPDKVKGISSGAPYIVDKLEQDRQKIENDILTMLGVNNVGIGEKKEHLIVDEVNANNQDIEEQDNAYESQLETDFDRVNKVFGKSIEVVDMNEEFMGEENPQEQEEEVDDDEDN